MILSRSLAMDSLLYHDHTAVIITALAVLITAVIFIWRYITYSPPPSSPTPPPPAVVDEPPVLAKLHKKPEHVKPLEHNHPLFIKHIKGHTDILTDVVFLRRVQGQTEPILVSSCRDRSIRFVCSNNCIMMIDCGLLMTRLVLRHCSM